jgi:hypothetical protein
MRTAYDSVSIADGEAARDRLIARARHTPEADLPDDLIAVAVPVLWWHDEQPQVENTAKNRILEGEPREDKTSTSSKFAEDEPRALPGGWWGFEHGAAYSPAADVSEQSWWINEHDRERRQQLYRGRRWR